VLKKTDQKAWVGLLCIWIRDEDDWLDFVRKLRRRPSIKLQD
jgi:hypothetical protein